MQTSYTRRSFLRAGIFRTIGQPTRAKFALYDGARDTPETPDEALQLLLEGNGRFMRQTFHSGGISLAELRTMGAVRETPFAAVVTCKEMRLMPDLIFDQNHGALRVLSRADSEGSPDPTHDLERVVAQQGAKLIVVLGHMGCGAVDAGDSSRAAGLDSSLLPYSGRAGAMLQAKVLREASPMLADRFRSGQLGIRSAEYDPRYGLVTMLPDDCPQNTRFETVFPHGAKG